MLGFLAFIAIVILSILLADTRGRLKRTEKIVEEAAKRIGALQRQFGDASAPPSPQGDIAPAPEAPRAFEEAPAAETLARWKAPPETEAPAKPAPAPEPVAQAAEPAPSIASEPEPADVPPPSVAARFENLFGKTLPIWAGGITLAIAGVLIVKYAIDLGIFGRIFTPPVQIVAGILFGLALIGGAEVAWRNEARLRDVRVPQALSGAGIATLYAAILVAANVYGLVGPLLAFAGLAIVTAAALALSLRFGAPSALLGLAGGLAAPALVGAAQPNVPMLATYLGLTIAGITGVSRSRRWPWLAAAALAGGAGWSLWLVLAGEAFDRLGSLSLGGLVLLLAIGIPTLAFDGPRAAAIRAAAAIVGALQLALLVAAGGFAPLHWGLFLLIAAAGQWLAWRDRAFAIVPTVGTALSLLLLGIWPDPSARWFTAVGLALAAIHAGPLLARLWQVPRQFHRAVELAAIALAAPPLVKWHYFAIADGALALVAVGGALLAAAGVALGWKAPDRGADARFALLATAAALLAALALALLAPLWAAPLAIAAIAALLLLFGGAAGDARLEPVAALFLLFAIALIGVTGAHPFAEVQRLFGLDGAVGARALLRWGGLALAALLFALRARHGAMRRGAQFVAALLIYGALAQIVPGGALMLVPALGAAACLAAMRRVDPARLDAAAIGFAALTLGWAAMPLLLWSGAAIVSLAGVPMTLDAAAHAPGELLLRLLIPAALIAAAVWNVRERLPRHAPAIAFALAAMLGGVALHAFYRIGFAAVAGSDFVAAGIAQRLVWEALLIGGGALALRSGRRRLAVALVVAGTAHLFWYGLTLHNPLWAAQAVGGWPLVNALAPLFLLAALGLMLALRLFPAAPPPARRAAEIARMLLALLFAWATLRQAFHGSLLVDPGVAPAENILRSLLILALAIAYLLWGIRTDRHDWRIASLLLMLAAVVKVFVFDASGLEGLLRIGSFIALGFSLIGIGWLYSRQLTGGASAAANHATPLSQTAPSGR